MEKQIFVKGTFYLLDLSHANKKHHVLFYFATDKNFRRVWRRDYTSEFFRIIPY